MAHLRAPILAPAGKASYLGCRVGSSKRKRFFQWSKKKRAEEE